MFALVLIDLIARSRNLFRGNAARKAMRPVVRRLAPVRPKRLARNGDSGFGIDNSVPWYHVYLIVDANPDLDEIVARAAWQGAVEVKWDITRDGEVKIYGNGRRVRWGELRKPPAGKAIVSLELVLAEIRN